MAITHVHLIGAHMMDLPLAINCGGLEDHVFKRTPESARVHPQAAADGSRNSDQKLEPRDIVPCCESGGCNISHPAPTSSVSLSTVMMGKLVSMDNNAFNAAIAHQQI